MNTARMLSLVAALFLGACATIQDETPPPGARVVEAPSPKVGDWWEIWGGGPSETVRIASIEGNQVRTNTGWILTKDANTIYIPQNTAYFHGHAARFYPHSQCLSFPLWSGKTWQKREWISADDGSTNSLLVSAKAGPWVKRYVNRKELDALRITCDYGGPQPFVCWYAPAAGRNIACDSGNEISYRVLEYGSTR